MKLVYTKDNNGHTAGTEVKPGDVVKDFRGDNITVESLDKPKSPASSGHVYTNQGRFYVSVIGAEWIDREDRAA